MYSIGLDIGTTSVCGILHDARTGEVIQSRTEPNDSWISTPNVWEKTQDPRRLLCILHTVVDALLEKQQSVVSIGITGQMHGIVYVDADGNPVSDLKIWQDGRGDLVYKDGKTYAAFMSEQTGYALATGYGAVTYFYDTVNGLVPEDAVSFCTIHDLAAMTLTENCSPLLHPSDAASLGLFDLRNNRYDQAAIEKLGLQPAMFPAVSSGFTVMGEYKGVPVAVAIGDNQASFLGAVSDMEQSLLVNVGTGSQISCLTRTVPENDGLDCRPLLENAYIMAGSSLCGGRAYAMLEKLFREIAETVSGETVKSAYPAMDKLMEQMDGTAEPLEVSTVFSGTRAAPQQRGSIDNIGVNNLTMAALCDGFMCGMVRELYEMFLQIKPYLPVQKRCMVGSGNGVRNNMPLRRRFEKLFGLPMVIPAHKEEAAFGASLFALVAAGVYADMSAAQQLIKYE